jgi:hypothetical protein
MITWKIQFKLLRVLALVVAGVAVRVVAASYFGPAAVLAAALHPVLHRVLHRQQLQVLVCLIIMHSYAKTVKLRWGFPISILLVWNYFYSEAAYLCHILRKENTYNEKCENCVH